MIHSVLCFKRTVGMAISCGSGANIFRCTLTDRSLIVKKRATARAGLSHAWSWLASTASQRHVLTFSVWGPRSDPGLADWMHIA